MTSPRIPVPGAGPTVADAGHLLVSALREDAAARREPTGGRRLGADASRPDPRYGLMPPAYKPLDLPLLARVAAGLKALGPEGGHDPAVLQPTVRPAVPARKAAPQADSPTAGILKADKPGVSAPRMDGSGAVTWPLFAGLGPLGALPTAPKLIRAFSTLVLGSWGLTAFQDDSELLMSELATNAVAAATGPNGQPRYDNSGRLHLLWARLLSDRKRLRIELWDTIPQEAGVPVRRQAQETDESGRGLELLGLLSASWGWEPVPGRATKKVWAELALPPDESAP